VSLQGKRKLIVALGAILAAAFAPASAVSIAAIAVAFFGAHAVQDYSWKPNVAD
jgi:hypothetical protein